MVSCFWVDCTWKTCNDKLLLIYGAKCLSLSNDNGFFYWEKGGWNADLTPKEAYFLGKK